VRDAAHPYAGFTNIINGFAIDARPMHPGDKKIFSINYLKILKSGIHHPNHYVHIVAGALDGSMNKIVGGAIGAKGTYKCKT
jgi:hypothetical protein